VSSKKKYDFKFYVRPLVNLTADNPLKDVFVAVETKAPGFAEFVESKSLTCVATDRLTIDEARKRLDWNVIVSLLSPGSDGEKLVGATRFAKVLSIVHGDKTPDWGYVQQLTNEEVNTCATAIRKVLQWRPLYTPPADRVLREKKKIASAAGVKASETRKRLYAKREEKAQQKPKKVGHAWLCACGAISIERYRQKPKVCAGCGSEKLVSRHLVWKPVI